MQRLVLTLVLAALVSCAENQHPFYPHGGGSDRSDMTHEGSGGGTTDRPATGGGGSDRRGGKH